MIIALQTLIFFRESILTALDRLLSPYYGKFSLTFNGNGRGSDDEDAEEQVSAEYDDEKGVVFYPPMYAQRYAAVSDCLMDERWRGKLEKVVDLGYHDMSFIKYLKEVPGIKCILGVDIESIPLRCSSDLLACDDYAPKRENPLQITLFQGNAADPDFRLIGCDAVIAIEMIEHMLPHDLDRLVHTVFGFIKPWIVIITTPNGDFNVLFKSLEKNGLRRWDHFFEWSREQFNDWSSNIVNRYPSYTVSCQGIGPGPPGTLHIGCCSQLALFVSKDYHKQQDLSLDSLALVAKVPSPNNLSDMIGSWESIDLIPENKLLPTNNDDSFPDLQISEKESAVNISIISPTNSLDALQYCDGASQCNLDSETAKAFLMFDDELACFDFLVPRRHVDHRVYDIEDVSCRLNCTTLQVRKFSKTTQKLMAKNKIDPIVHTREVVDEIRHLTKMLNFNKDSITQSDGECTWSNINWGDNAPYWNQYYKIVREYNYPFETRSVDCRILDLISDEINRLIDAQYDNELSMDVCKLEIPVPHLMRAVAHITDDVDKVRELLEWNGYQLVDDVVVHSRLVDTASLGSHEDDWQDNDTYSDWDTDVHSTSISDGSTLIPDLHGRLRRALDHKVRKLRTMLTADEDITAELDRVVCRLMKLALRTSKGRLTPPPTRWMQCKLLDMLTLTEKAIERRQRYFIENYPLRELTYDEDKRSENIIALDKIKADNTANVIVDKYLHLAQSSVVSEKSGVQDTCCLDLNSENLSKELLKDTKQSAPKVMFHETTFEVNLLEDEIDTKLERTQAWVEEDIEVVPYPNHDIKYENSSGDTDHSTSNVVRHKYKRNSKRQKNLSNMKKSNMKLDDHSQNKILNDNELTNKKPEELNEDKAMISKMKKRKKMSRRKSSCNNLFRNSKKLVSIDYGYSAIKNGKKKHVRVIPAVAQPIPDNFKELCHPESITEKKSDRSSLLEEVDNDRTTISSNVAATEKSFLIDIVTDEMEETIALRRSIGTDADDSTMDSRTIIGSVSTVNVHSGNLKLPENIRSETIFLYDINEPTTSKGIRHTSMDVQCGPDVAVPTYSVLSSTTSLTKMSKIFTSGIKIGESFTNVRFNYSEFGKSTFNHSEFGTSTNDSDAIYKIITPRMRSTGIRIKDSDTHLSYCLAYSTVTKTISESQITSLNTQDFSTVTETESLKPVSSGIRIEDSGSEAYGGFVSPLHLGNNCKNISNIQSKSSVINEVEIMDKVSATKYEISRLCCGGVHVHSFRDKDISEDIVYQGEWQRYRSKLLTKRKPYSPLVIKKVTVTESVNKKLRVQSMKVKPESKILKKTEHIAKVAPQKKPFQIRNTRLLKIKQEIANKANDIKKPKTSTKFLLGTVKINKPANIVPKVATKLTISTLPSNNINKTFSGKKTTTLPSITSNKNNNKPEIPDRRIRKNYLPQYLRRNKSLSPRRNRYHDKGQSTVNQIKNEKRATHNPRLERSKTEEIRTDLLKFRKELHKHVNYHVFCNELRNKKSTSDDESTGNRDNTMGTNSTLKPPIGLQSQTSSTCSSPNSFVTIRAASKRSKILNKRHPVPTNKNNFTSESENSTPSRNKKYYKRCQNIKKSDDINCDNKENIPESSGRAGKGVFTGRHKRIFMAQLTTDSSTLQSAMNSVSKQKPQVSNKSNIKIPTVDSSHQKKVTSPSFSKQKYTITNGSSTADDSYQEDSNCFNNSIKNSNLVLVMEQIQAEMVVPDIHEDSMGLTSVLECNSTVCNSFLSQWIDNNNNDSQTSNILSSMRQLIEETLEFIDAHDNLTTDSESLIHSGEDIMNASPNVSLSPTSLKTVIPYEDENFNTELPIEIEQALNRTFDTISGDESIFSSITTDTKLNTNDFDVLSFKSLTTVSKASEYFLADSELNHAQVVARSSSRASSIKSTSVKDIFERKDHFQSQNPGGTFANQAFSGFSIDGEPVAGDQPDHVNVVDSETGSMAVEVTRQATSEELFISGRSSESYESCLIDEDSVVPYWLFQIISQQQSVEEEQGPAELENGLPEALVLPMEEPMFDVNGNMMDGVAVGAGAGDGRGMHSDHSQDSSGQGTSLSSSDMSSGPQSDAVLVDPSAFAAQFELLRVPAGGSVVGPINVSGSQPPGVRNENEVLSSSRAEPIRNPRLSQMAASDADVSSTDTDVPDSSSI